jgi:hypothetical protein
MADITEEEKYRRKTLLLQRALTAADEMDKMNTEKEDSAAPTKKTDQDCR